MKTQNCVLTTYDKGWAIFRSEGEMANWRNDGEMSQCLNVSVDCHFDAII